MIPTRKGIIVRCDPDQKELISVGGKSFKCALKFATNYREKSETLAVVVQGSGQISEGSIIVAHHTLFYGESPWALGDGLFSIPVNDNIFAIIDEDGNPHCIGNNILAQRIIPELSHFTMPESYKKSYKDRVVILENYREFKKGQQVFTLNMADYEIVYNWNGEERRVIKIKYQDIVAILKK